jgi:hypothetical protein
LFRCFVVSLFGLRVTVGGASLIEFFVSSAAWARKTTREIGFDRATGLGALAFLLAFISPQPGRGQGLVLPHEPGAPITMQPSDVAIFEANEGRKDLPCNVTPRKADLGFDLRFHTGYDVTVPLNELEGGNDVLSIVFRVVPDSDHAHPYFFYQHIRVPPLEDDVSGRAALEGGFDLGEGSYHVDWLMRDRAERICSSSWDVEAALPARDRQMALFLPAGRVDQSLIEPFADDPALHRLASNADPINIKVLVNFAPQSKESAKLQPTDTTALVSILKAIDRDSRVEHVSLVAFNLQEQRVLYRQNQADHIDFVALGKAIQDVKPGVVDLNRLAQKHGDTDFLASLMEQELGPQPVSDAVIFAGPKALLDADVPQEDLRRIGDVECPLFYMNYNLSPQAIPWRDSISHAVHFFKGTEYTITKPRDLWFATNEMVERIVHSKHTRLSRAAYPQTR